MWLASDILLPRGQPRGIPMCARALAQNKSVRRDFSSAVLWF